MPGADSRGAAVSGGRKEGRKDAGGSVETVAHNVWLVCGEGVGSPE